MAQNSPLAAISFLGPFSVFALELESSTAADLAGQRGARIDPKGCKVRTTKDIQGNKRQYNKQGQEKFKITEIRNEHAVTIAGSRQYATVVRHWKTTTGPNAMSVAQKGAFKRNHKMIYDTGATMTTPTWYTIHAWILKCITICSK